MASVHYREFQPGPPLASFVRCYWTLQAGAELQGAVNRFFPDGSMEMVFHLGDPFFRGGERQARTLLIGQQWSPVEVVAERRSDCAGIRFHPGGAYPFLRFAQHEVAGSIVSLEDVIGSRAAGLCERLAEAPNAGERVALLESFLLAMAPAPMDPLGYLSPRQYRRRFETEIGIPPKLFQRIQRFQKALVLLKRMLPSDAAQACGYYDQPHLSRDFRQFAGISPATWLREQDVLFFQDSEEGESLNWEA